MIKYSELKTGELLKVIGLGSPGFADAGEIVTVTKTYFNKVRVEKPYGIAAYFEGRIGAERLEIIKVSEEQRDKYTQDPREDLDKCQVNKELDYSAEGNS